MLTKEENELLTRVGPGTPMGELMRRYWLPALLTAEIPGPDSPPVRVRLLGEDLIAFRDTSGRVGLIHEFCAHRSASLFYGRNEEGGLRCIYHGWKYDVEGRIVETPVEPPQSLLRHVVQQVAYPCRERNGLVFAYMGPRAKLPPLPELPCLTLPPEQMVIGSKILNECNWLQGLEGDCDNTHSIFLHRRLRGGRISFPPARFNSPVQDIEVTGWGVRGATIYPASDDMNLVRTNVFTMPCVGSVPEGEAREGSVPEVHTIWQVPRDDVTTWRYDVFLNLEAPIVDVSRHEQTRQEVGPGFVKLANRTNDYLIDREKQRSQLVYCGIDFGAHIQDAAVTESVGQPIIDRTREHLGVADAQIAAIRQYLLKALRDVREGRDPPLAGATSAPGALHDFYLVNSLIPKGQDWRLSAGYAGVQVQQDSAAKAHGSNRPSRQAQSVADEVRPNQSV